MTPLREQLIQAMQMHGFSPRIHDSYLRAAFQLVRYYDRSPDTLSIAELERYFQQPVMERNLAPAAVRLALNGIRFLCIEVLQWPESLRPGAACLSFLPRPSLSALSAARI